MANVRIRLTDQVIEQLSSLGQSCGIDDHNQLIKLLIRKYGDDLTQLLAPTNTNTVMLSHSVPMLDLPAPLEPTSDKTGFTRFLED